jgi:rubredoxin
MNEYISREAVINITAETGAWETQNRVRELPAADVQPIKHGRWVVDEHGYLRCDNCGEVCLRNDIGIYVKSWYCPECGADMRLRGATND